MDERTSREVDKLADLMAECGMDRVASRHALVMLYMIGRVDAILDNPTLNKVESPVIKNASGVVACTFMEGE